MAERVECYSGSEYAERPLAFFWQGRRLEVKEIISRARTPAGKLFVVRAEDGQLFELQVQAEPEEWSIRQV